MHGEFQHAEVIDWVAANLPGAEVTTLEPVHRKNSTDVIALRWELSNAQHFARLLVGKETAYPSLLVYRNDRIDRPIKVTHGKADVKAVLLQYFGS